MGFTSLKYHFKATPAIVAMLFCIFFNTKLHAQDYQDSLDNDSGVTTIDDDPPPQETDSRTRYFKQRKDEGAGITPFTVRHIPREKLNTYKKDPEFWYADSAFAAQQQLELERERSGKMDSLRKRQAIEAAERRDRNRSTKNTLMWILVIAGFLTFLVIFLGNSNVRLFRKSHRVEEGETEAENTEDIFAINYQKEIDKAAANGNYRVAIRLMFLRLLKEMSQKNIIQYRADRTNFDYLLQVNQTNYYQDFFRLTRNYEYAWYGKFDISEQAYQQVKTEFENFQATRNR